MNVVLPLCGLSSRFSSERPKWMLTHPDGRLMVEHALEGFTGKIYAGVRYDHDYEFNASNVLRKAFGERVKVVVIEKTGSQVETIFKIITAFDLQEEPIIIRDCDNKVSWNPTPASNAVVGVTKVRGLQDNNKGYFKALTNYFNVGTIYLPKGNMINYSYKTTVELINNLEDVEYEIVDKYVDWGTQEDWDEEVAKYKTYFIDLDGVVFKNASKYFAPYWEDSEPLMANVEWIKSLPVESRVIYVSARPDTPEMHNLTSRLLNGLGIPGELILGLPHSQRIIINDKSPNASYDACKAVNIVRNGKIEDCSGC